MLLDAQGFFWYNMQKYVNICQLLSGPKSEKVPLRHLLRRLVYEASSAFIFIPFKVESGLSKSWYKVTIKEMELQILICTG